MLTMNQPYVAGVAFSAVFTVTAVLLATLTLLPALIGFAGRNIDRLGLPRRRRAQGDVLDRKGFWFTWSRSVQRRPVVAGLAGLAVLTVLILPVFGLKLGFPDAGNDAESTTTRQAYDLITEGFGPGANGTFVLVADRGDGRAVAVLDELAGDLRATTGVAAVSPVVPNADGSAAVITLVPVGSPQNDETIDLLATLRDTVVPQAVAGTGVSVSIGGLTAANADQTQSIASRLPIFIGAVIGLSFLLLLAVFRSVPVAVKAGILNLLSIIAAYGVVSLAAQGGWFGSLFGITTPTPIPAFIPMMMFAILFGLSMDYEVFLLSRIREEYLRTKDTSLAVADGIASTAKVITAAALIMTVVFGAFVFDDQVFLKIIGIGMAAAVIIDATVIRLLLVPAVMQLLGDRAWWMPRWLDRAIPVLDIEGPASHPAAGRPEVTAPATTTPTITIGA
jgi:RND superfamily putative drug exporter